MCASPKVPTLEPSESARESLRSAAKKLFSERGFDGVRVKEVAAAAGYNPALINYHFGGKEGLYRECLIPLIGTDLENMKRTLRSPSSKQDFLTRFTLFAEEYITNSVRGQEACLIL